MLNRRELLQKGATVAAGTLALGRVPSAWGQDAGGRDEHRPVHHRSGAGDPAFPARLVTQASAGFDAPAATWADVRERVLQRRHVLADARDDVDRLLPGAARREVHARGGHGRRRVPAGRAAAELQEHRHRDGGRRLQRRLQGQVAPQQARRERVGSHRTSRSTASPRWSPPDAGANQDIDQEGGGTTDNDGNYMTPTGIGRSGQGGGAAVPEHGRRTAAAVLLDRLAGQPARRAAVPEELPSRAGTTTRG